MTKIVGISGSASQASRTQTIIETTIRRIAEKAGGTTHLISVGELLPDLGVAGRDAASPRLADALERIESADLLVVGSPVYKGSYTGLLKHLIDLIDYRALAGVPVGLIATGGSDRHALVVEHQLRPLFGFFIAKTLPTAVFIVDRTIGESGSISDEPTRTRLQQLVVEAADALSGARKVQFAAVS